MTTRTYLVVMHGSALIVGRITTDLTFDDKGWAEASTPAGKPVTFMRDEAEPTKLWVRRRHAPRVEQLEGYEP